MLTFHLCSHDARIIVPENVICEVPHRCVTIFNTTTTTTTIFIQIEINAYYYHYYYYYNPDEVRINDIGKIERLNNLKINLHVWEYSTALTVRYNNRQFIALPAGLAA